MRVTAEPKAIHSFFSRMETFYGTGTSAHIHKHFLYNTKRTRCERNKGIYQRRGLAVKQTLVDVLLGGGRSVCANSNKDDAM